jgi:hypothetical protein
MGVSIPQSAGQGSPSSPTVALRIAYSLIYQRMKLHVFLAAVSVSLLASCSSTSRSGARYEYNPRNSTELVAGKAVPRDDAPSAVRRAIEAGNRIAGKPYRMGGGHRRLEDTAYDCSGTVSYLLCNAGLLDEPTDSDGFRKYGQRGEGEHITVWAKDGHAFIVVDGLRMDTTSGGQERRGPRWTTSSRSLRGFRPRHPAGL